MMRFLFPLLLLLTSPALAQDMTSLVAYSEGHYEVAASQARASATADGYAFAARALLARGMCSDGQPAEELLDAAEEDARTALSLDENHLEGRLQLAIALSLKIRPLSTREARKTGYGPYARDLAEEVLEVDPGNVYANGFLSVWNIEVVRRGGGLGARIMGAGVKKGRRYYHTAVAASPDDIALHWQYARALAALNARKYRDEINLALDRAMSTEPEDQLARVMAARAEILKEALSTQDRKAVQVLAISML